MRRKERSQIRTGGGSHLRIGIALAQFNSDITENLLRGAEKALREWGVPTSHVQILRGAGSFELPLLCWRLIKKHNVDAVIALGCIIKGETQHDKYIAQAVFNGLTRIMLDTGIPIGLGVLTTNTLTQAKARSSGATNHGEYAASAALEIASLQ